MEERLARKKELEIRTKRFAVAVFRFLRSLPSTIDGRVIGYQLGKAASSIGANYREANRAESREDFVHKIGIVLKETSETVYWLEVITELDLKMESVRELLVEANELLRIFQCSNRSLRTKRLVNRKID